MDHKSQFSIKKTTYVGALLLTQLFLGAFLHHNAIATEQISTITTNQENQVSDTDNCAKNQSETMAQDATVNITNDPKISSNPEDALNIQTQSQNEAQDSLEITDKQNNEKEQEGLDLIQNNELDLIYQQHEQVENLEEINITESSKDTNKTTVEGDSSNTDHKSLEHVVKSDRIETNTLIIKNEMPAIEAKSDSLQETKKTLTEKDIKDHVNKYSEEILEPVLKELYRIFDGDTEVLRNIPSMDCYKYQAEISKSGLADAYPDVSDALIKLNLNFDSHNIGTLKTSELYQDALNGVMCSEPKSIEESYDIVQPIRDAALSKYKEIIDELESSKLE